MSGLIGGLIGGFIARWLLEYFLRLRIQRMQLEVLELEMKILAEQWRQNYPALGIEAGWKRPHANLLRFDVN